MTIEEIKAKWGNSFDNATRWRVWVDIPHGSSAIAGFDRLWDAQQTVHGMSLAGCYCNAHIIDTQRRSKMWALTFLLVSMTAWAIATYIWQCENPGTRELLYHISMVALIEFVICGIIYILMTCGVMGAMETDRMNYLAAHEDAIRYEFFSGSVVGRVVEGLLLSVYFLGLILSVDIIVMVVLLC